MASGITPSVRHLPQLAEALAKAAQLASPPLPKGQDTPSLAVLVDWLQSGDVYFFFAGGGACWN
jgi:hypothetical protein